MIEPIIEEDIWLEALHGLPTWHPGMCHTLVIAPHPDDETLGAGGLIAYQRRCGNQVSIIAVTDGEAAYDNEPNLAEIRRAEQESALKVLGVEKNDIVRLGLPDSQVCEDKLASLISKYISGDTLVIAPWHYDWHPDHEACGRAAQSVCGEAGATLASYLFWSWHRSTPEKLPTQKLRRFPLSEQLWLAKYSAIARYRSQLHPESGDPVLSPLLTKPALRPFETYIRHD